MKGEVTIRGYQPGDEHAILQTFNLVFREVCGPGFVDRTLEQWRWQYLENPVGQRMSLAVADDGTVVSQYAGVPVLADSPKGPLIFVHCVDSMTHPDWRAGLKRPGMFVVTGLPFSAHSRRIDDAVLYGFPVDVAFRIGTRYLEYQFLRVIDFLIRDVALPPIEKPAAITLERVPTIPDDIGVLHDVVRTEKHLLLRRDHRYLHWRYVSNPARADYELWTARANGALRGFLVLKPGSGLAPEAATIADWLCSEHDEAARDALLHVACVRAREENKLRLMTVFPEWSVEWRALAERGFQKTPSANWLERRLVYLITGSQLDLPTLETKWWYALGDSDLA